jgi:hypothetical protein
LAALHCCTLKLLALPFASLLAITVPATAHLSGTSSDSVFLHCTSLASCSLLLTLLFQAVHTVHDQPPHP